MLEGEILAAEASASVLDRIFLWLRAKERWLVLLAVVAQVIVLLALTAWSSAPLRAGGTILLQVEPVDPRDMFRGEYVALGYDFSTKQPSDRLAAARTDGAPVYAILQREPDGKHWKVAALTFQRPTSGKYLSGTYSTAGPHHFGIESFFVQEGKSLQYEKAVRDRKLWAEIGVTADGHASVRRLRIE